MKKFISTSPFRLLSDGYSVAEVVEYQTELESHGNSLWDYPSFEALYLCRGVTFGRRCRRYTPPDKPQVYKKQMITQELGFYVPEDILNACIDKLPRRQKDCLVTRYMKHMSNKECANYLGCSLAAFSGSRVLAIKRLKRLLVEEGYTYVPQV